MPAASVALDIGTYSIKAIRAKAGAKVNVERVVEVFNETGIALPTDDASVAKLGQMIDAVFNDNELPRTDVRLALPETVVSTKVISIPPLSDAELASAIGWQAEQHIPIPPEELSLEYQVLHRPEKKEDAQMRVLLVGTRKRMVERFIGMFNEIGIEPTLLETQILAIMRSLQFTQEDPTTLIAHMGSSSMNLAIVHKGELQFVISHMNGGQMLTKALETSIGLDAAQAEQYKRSYGLDGSQFQGKVRDALLPPVNMLLTEVRKSVQFFINQNPQETVQRVVLSGGTSMLPSLVQHITNELGVEVLIASPFSGVEGAVPENVNPPAMSVCMGLLQREET
ncbi:MAG: pilus assembly protein PilM [Patescibacteria group bacterium]|nr:MAG: pilus assembly protein PilM [Patescibacteria group bacterium]